MVGVFRLRTLAASGLGRQRIGRCKNRTSTRCGQMFMGTSYHLRKVEDRLINDLRKTSIPLAELGKKYGVSRQAISGFVHRKGIIRPKRDHLRNCSICQGLIKIARKPHSDFISSKTIRKQLGVAAPNLRYHIGILRKKGLLSHKFGRLHSERAELAYQIYFKKRLPVTTIGKQAGLKNFPSLIKSHRLSGWDIPAPLFLYDEKGRREVRLKKLKKIKREKKSEHS